MKKLKILFNSSFTVHWIGYKPKKHKKIMVLKNGFNMQKCQIKRMWLFNKMIIYSL